MPAIVNTFDFLSSAFFYGNQKIALGGEKVDLVYEARKKAYTAVRHLWNRARMTKEETYKWLAKQLGITVEECQIKRFDVEMCNKVIVLCLDKVLSYRK